VDIDNPYNIKILEFNKNIFDNSKELRVITGSTASQIAGSGWVMPNLSLSGSAGTGSRMAFDFKNRDYAILLSFSGNLTNTGIEFLKYKITGENIYGSGLYINPIDDSGDGVIRYFGADMLMDRDGDSLYKEFEVVKKK
jgi:hypothetical protein